jgi:hypothetical protein
MNYRVRQKNGKRYVECLAGKACIESERDALDWVAICGETESSGLLLHAGNLSPDFFDLKTGLAGAVLQKFVTYGVRVAAVLPQELVGKGRFWEMVIEANRGRQFHVSPEQAQAEDWLLGD